MYLSDLGIATVASAEDALEAQFTVTIVDMAFTFGDEEITSLDIKAGESAEVEVTIIPASASGTVNWSTTAVSGINLVKNGNKVTVKVADDMETGKTYNLIATYGNYSKEIQINIVADHVCNYENEEITKNATCTEVGSKTLTCSECGKTKTEEIPVDPDAHNYEGAICTNCRIELEAGLYDANGVLLCAWEDAEIDIETNYTNSTATNKKNPGAVIFNNYPETVKIVIPNTVSNVGSYAFCGIQNSNLREVVLPNSITQINSNTFWNSTDITKITIPEGITTIKSDAFYGSGITSIGIKGSGADMELPNSLTTVENEGFRSMYYLTSIVIPKTLTNMGSNIFRNCNSLTNVVFEEGITTIPSGMFLQCESIESITIPEGVTKIENSAFGNCKNLTTINIPNSVTSIGKYAFDCDNLTNVIFADTTTWYVGDSEGATTTQVDVTNSSTNATNFKDTYYNKFWTKTE